MAELSLYKVNQDIYVKADKVTATTTSNGLMSISDKIKLDGIETNAKNYVLPTATATILGGVKVGAGLAITASGILSATLATTTANGLMSSTDKIKLDNVAVNANNYILPKSTASSLGGVMIGSGVTVDNNGIISIGLSSTTANGLMSISDKTKLNNIQDNAEVNQNAYSHIKVGNNTLSAGYKADTLELISGANILLTPNVASDSVTISVSGKVTAASTADLANSIPTVDVGGNIWLSNASDGTVGTSGTIAFGSANAPANPQVNQIWFDVADRLIKFYDGANWQPFGAVYM